MAPVHDDAPQAPLTIEVFADLRCPFTHVGLRRLVERRRELGDEGAPRLHVRAWPLELVNAEPLDPALVAEEIEELRAQVAPELFAGFDVAAFPDTSMPGLRLIHDAYREGTDLGERVSLALRTALFEEGRDIADEAVLEDVAGAEGVTRRGEATDDDVVADWREGQRRGVIGSPHFFVAGGDWFCPALEISRVGDRLRIDHDPGAFDRFVAACLRR